MAAYRVFYTATFEKKLAGLEKEVKEWVEKIADKLAENPFVGKPLGVKWFREKKFGKHRVYYLIYEEMQSVYIVNISDKKNQQAVINSARAMLEVYRKELLQQFEKRD